MALSIDFGTSNTAAAVSTPAGGARPLLFDGFPLLPSAVCVDADRIHTGRDAVQWGGSRPDAFEPWPKRRIDDGVLLLGARELQVEDVIAAVLGRVAAEAPGAGEVVLTHPAAWGPHRRAVLTAAATRAGLGAPRLVAEPVAAAHRVAALGHDVPVGRTAVVYDFGGGTFDASVLTRTAEGFVVVASEGLPDAGGLDIDEAVLGVLAATMPDAGGAWERLLMPANSADRRAARQLREEVRGAKEMLSRGASASVYVPLLDRESVLGRPQFELVARPVIERTVAATRSALRAAGPETGTPAAIFMVGGSSRIPLAAVLLHRAFGVAPVVLEQPELVVALGALATPTASVAQISGTPPMTSGAPPPEPATAGLRPGGPLPTEPLPAEPLLAAPLLAAPLPAESSPAEPAPADARPGADPPWQSPGPALIGIGMLLALLLFIVVVLNNGSSDVNAADPSAPPSRTGSPSASPSPAPSLSPYPPPVDVCDKIEHDHLRDVVGTEVMEFFVPDPSPTMTSINGNRATILCYFGYTTRGGDVGVLTADITDWTSAGVSTGWLGVLRRDTEELAKDGTTVTVEDVTGAGDRAFRYEVRPPTGYVRIGMARADRNLALDFWVRSDEIRYDGPERYAVTDALRADTAATLANLLAS
ncbi:Hsp70 family protein [Catenuloplanes sp. NPDC051500]|uniref:Hsp70 family protein n=1 Tax=Catenuloplanes sp. NPDC051500 TaxID=3363959 RepID=UPI003792067D